jgi:uncharacterized protein YllA (UPF0747 family)
VGWLLVADELDGIYFTASPPDFALEQADWYVRADVTTFLEEPERLSQVVQQYPFLSDRPLDTTCYRSARNELS